MKVAVSNCSYHYHKMATETTTVLQFVTKVYLMKLIFRNFDYYMKM